VSALAPAPASLVGETVFGDRYELMVVRVGIDEAVVSVCLDVGGDTAEPDGHLTLTPDEARSLASDLVRWAGHAEREGRR